MSVFDQFQLDEGKFIDLLTKLIGESKYLQVGRNKQRIHSYDLHPI